MVQKALDLLCDQFKGCETLAFVDLSTHMVLVANSTSPESQDTLNTMCRDAGAMLKSGNSALAGSDKRLLLFLRAEAEPSDALFCVCDLNTDLDEFMPSAQECLNSLSNGGAADE